MAESTTASEVVGTVVQIAGPAIDCQFPEGQIPEVHFAVRIVSEGFNVPEPIDIICETQQHIGEGRVRTIAMQPTEGLVRGMKAISLGTPHHGSGRAQETSSDACSMSWVNRLT